MTLRLDISFEFFPPAAGPAEAGFWTALDRLAPLDPGFISLTYGAGGTTRERNDHILRALLARGRALPAGHLTCVGAPRADTDAVARDWAAAGLRRVVALRGDMPGLKAPYAPHPEGYRNAAELVAGLRRISDFDISVAAYPERHPRLVRSRQRPGQPQEKVRRRRRPGADPVLFRRRDLPALSRSRAPRRHRRTVGSGYFTDHRLCQDQRLLRALRHRIPAWLAARFEGLDSDPETCALVAATTASELCQRLITEGITAFHFYTLNKAPLSLAICLMLGLKPSLQEAA